MLGIQYLKAPPTTFVFQYTQGKLKRSGPGLSFFYSTLASEIVRVPLTSVDVPFAFMVMTADFQDVTVQGELTYRIADPALVASALDFSVDAAGRYRSDDPTKLNDRLVQPAQALTRAFTQQRRLRDLLLGAEELMADVYRGLQESELVRTLGTEVLSFSVLSIAPTPEMSKAIQADAREDLLRKADEAVYARRNAAVELERQIKENELNTEVAVELKKRSVRETRMVAEIAVEQRRAELVDHRVANERKEADVRAYALRSVLEALKDADWKTLMAASGGNDARGNIAIAFRELAERAERIGNLNITPDLLSTLLADDDAPKGGSHATEVPAEHRRGQKGNSA